MAAGRGAISAIAPLRRRDRGVDAKNNTCLVTNGRTGGQPSFGLHSENDAPFPFRWIHVGWQEARVRVVGHLSRIWIKRGEKPGKDPRALIQTGVHRDKEVLCRAQVYAASEVTQTRRWQQRDMAEGNGTEAEGVEIEVLERERVGNYHYLCWRCSGR